ncbi:MAG: DUF2961 domain-containing protein [Janthinobacterium lividum]
MHKRALPRRSTQLLLVCFLFLTLLPAALADAGTPLGVAALLKPYTDLRSLPQLSKNVVSLASSYDRTGGNADFGKFLRQDGDEAVMAEMDGPGAIVRLWSANPNGELRIYLDNSPTPVMDVPFASISKGAAPFTSPLSGFSTGGAYTYLPVPYARHCKVVVTGSHDLYYQVGFVTFPKGTAVRPFSLPLPPADQSAVDAVNASWAAFATPPLSLPGLVRPFTIAPGATITAAVLKGPGVVTHLRLALPDTADTDVRRIILRAYFDGHKTPDIQAPVGDFFGNPVGRKPFRSLFLGCAADGAFVADFQMPFARTARFTLESRETGPKKAFFSTDFSKASFDPGREGYFHAAWRQETTRPGAAYQWIQTAGQRGRFVGVVQDMAGTHGLGFLEGDDQFRVDAQTWIPAPLYPMTVIGPWNGTGTEDCFNSAGYFDHGPNALPMNGLLEDFGSGLITAYRWFVNDAPTFQFSIEGRLEHGGLNDSSGEVYSSVSFWYSDGPAPARISLSPSENLNSPRVIVPQFFVPNAIEGESLRPAITSGVAENQWLGAGWSSENQLWWRGAAAGDTLTASVTPPAAGTYELYGFLTKARDYGQVSVRINGTPVGGIQDCYAPALTRPAATDIGPVTLPAGPSTLIVTIAGKNSAATGTLFGLDCLVFNPPGARAPEMVCRPR